MSKEKNLTYLSLGTGKMSVDAREHEWMRYDRYGVRYDQLNGPAIDRLHEFEKLGLEPEEIRGRLEAADDYRKEIAALEKDNNNLRALNQREFDTMYELRMEIEGLKKQIRDTDILLARRESAIKKRDEYISNLEKDLAWFQGQHGVLQVQHSNQADTIKRLMDENEESRKEIADRERNEERLREVIRNQNELIEKLKDGVFRDEIIKNYMASVKNYAGENAVLEMKNANQFKEIVELRAENKELEKHISELYRAVGRMQED